MLQKIFNHSILLLLSTCTILGVLWWESIQVEEIVVRRAAIDIVLAGNEPAHYTIRTVQKLHLFQVQMRNIGTSTVDISIPKQSTITNFTGSSAVLPYLSTVLPGFQTIQMQPHTQVTFELEGAYTTGILHNQHQHEVLIQTQYIDLLKNTTASASYLRNDSIIPLW